MAVWLVTRAPIVGLVLVLGAGCSASPSPLYAIRPGTAEEHVRQLGGEPDQEYHRGSEKMASSCVKADGTKVLVYELTRRPWELWKSPVESRILICIGPDFRVISTETEIVTH